MRAALVLLLCGCAGAPVRPASHPWAELAAADLDAIHRTILDDHPGPVDAENPGFRVWLETGYRESKALVPRVDSYGGYTGVIRRYVAGFRDGHLGLGFRIQASTRRWPGFTVGRRGEAYVVREAGADLPAGAVLTGCDGRTPAAMMTEQVFAFAGNPRLEADWVRLAPTLFADAANPFRALPARCDFAVDGAARTVTLVWKDIDNRVLNDKLTAAAFGAAPDFGVRELADGTIWVSLPSFSTEPAIAEKLRPIVERAASWRPARRVVFDVRGNTGGSSEWGRRLAYGLFGEDHVKAARLNAAVGRPAVYVEWRASAAVQAHVEKLVVDIGATMGADSRAWLESVARGLAEARAAGRTFFVEKDDEPAPTAKVPVPPPATQARVFFLTDGRCGSACLDFADVLHAVPGIVHVGSPTSADTQYMEVRPQLLPSGIIQLNLATKVWRNRPRVDNPYVPRHRFAGDMGDTAALEAWIAALPD